MPSLILKDELWTLVAFNLTAFHSITVNLLFIITDDVYISAKLVLHLQLGVL